MERITASGCPARRGPAGFAAALETGTVDCTAGHSGSAVQDNAKVPAACRRLQSRDIQLSERGASVGIRIIFAVL